MSYRLKWANDNDYLIKTVRKGRRQNLKFPKLSLKDFALQAWKVVEPGKQFVDNWHIDVICEHLEAVKKREITRLLVNIGPRFSKSFFKSISFPAWVWTEEPETRFICASHSDRLALTLSVKSRRLIQSDWYQAMWGKLYKLTTDQNVKSKYDNDAQGCRISLSIFGSIIGEGADIIIIDDPHDAKEFNSESALSAAIEGYKALYSRQDSANSAIIVVGQRISKDDLSGYLLEEGGWEHVSIPTEFDGIRRSTVLGAYDRRVQIGEVLCSDRFDKFSLAKTKNMDADKWEAQHQQNPLKNSLRMFNRESFKFINGEDIGARMDLVCFIDLAKTAPSPGKDPDWTAMLLMGRDRTRERYIVLEVDRWQDTPGVIEERVREKAGIYKKKYGVIEYLVEEEKGASGAYATHHFVTKVLLGYRCSGAPVKGDKTERARGVAAEAKAGGIYIKKDDHWNREFLDEMEQFPFGSHRDQGDCLSGAYNRLREPNEMQRIIEEVSRFKIVSGEVCITKGRNQGQKVRVEEVVDYGYLQVEGGRFAIARVWLHEEVCYVVEVVRREGEITSGLQDLVKLHEKRNFAEVGVAQEIYKLYEPDFEMVEESIEVIGMKLPADLDKAILLSGISRGKLLFGEHIIANIGIWSEVINYENVEGEARKAIVNAVYLAQMN